MQSAMNASSISCDDVAQSSRLSEDLKGAQFIVQSNLKVMSRAVATLAKLSEDMQIEVSESGLMFRSFNRSRSSQCLFRFAPDFFNDCDLSLINTKVNNVLRMSMKVAQSVFKGVHFNDKNFVSCEFRIDPNAAKLAVKLNLNYDVTRTIHAKLLECSGNLLKPVHDKSSLRNTTVIFASILSPILSQMKNDCEVTWSADQNSLRVKNFNKSDNTNNFNITDMRSKSKKVRTETSISVENITRHDVKFPVELSFPLREFSAVVTFAEQLSSEVCIYYDIPGKPIIVSIEAHSNFEIELLSATTTDDENFEVEAALFQEVSINEGSQEQSVSKRRKQRGRCAVPPPPPENDEVLLENTPPMSTNKSRRNEIVREKESSEDPELEIEEIVVENQEEEGNNSRIIAANNSWRQHEIVEGDERNGMEMEETRPEEQMDDQQYNPPMEGVEELDNNHQAEQSSSRMGFLLENDDTQPIGKTPPPEHAHFAIPEAKRRKTLENNSERMLHVAENDKFVNGRPINRKLRLILMRNVERKSHMKEVFSGRRILVSDTQRS